METLPNHENQPAEIRQLSEFSAEERKMIDEINSHIDIYDSQAVLEYGVPAQKEISGFSDQVLNKIRAKDSGEIGEVLTDLMIKVKELDIDSLDHKDGFLSNLLGNIKSRAGKFMARYDKLSVQIEKIIAALNDAKSGMLTDISLLDDMYDKNIEYLKNLDYYIMAGTVKLQELNGNVIPDLKAAAEQSNDPADAQKVKDTLDLVNRFEKKLHDLKLSRMISIQTAPQLRIIQSNDQMLVEKIQSSILNTIPLWKNQIIIALTLLRQEKALILQKEVTDTTNELLSRNSELLKENSINVAKESERGIVDIETLKKVNADLIETIEETLRIQSEGKEKRRLAEQELSGLEQQLRRKLLEAGAK